jgi:hypothetical protein
VAPGKHRFDRVGIRPKSDVGFVDCASQGRFGEHGCEIDEGARNSGHWDAAPSRFVGEVGSASAAGDHSIGPALRSRENFGQ